ncbi:hypothetical protein [Anaplasma phagocytophilum]|uniref:Uncharacterized protein n=1 Tax=Anaplasma phagocytophilum str. CRT53-1 TaxID=1359157 RepID=A0A0F3PX05_ANAPH|nr:hypothetical protein [Anaplasma phagocytophilum]KJV83699.1 hypothetical protein APHCRT_1295 [Anaplasma phagocytophilum str. CRT53-1]
MANKLAMFIYILKIVPGALTIDSLGIETQLKVGDNSSHGWE